MNTSRFEDLAIRAYDAMRESKIVADAAAERLIDLKCELQNMEAEAASNGILTGKNADERRLKSIELFGDVHFMVAAAERNKRRTELERELAKDEVERIRLLVRIDQTIVYE